MIKFRVSEKHSVLFIITEFRITHSVNNIHRPMFLQSVLWKSVGNSGFSFLNSSGLNLFSLQTQQEQLCGKPQSGIQQRAEKSKSPALQSQWGSACVAVVRLIRLPACKILPSEPESTSSSLPLYLKWYSTGKAPHWCLAVAACAFIAPECLL